MPAVWNSGSDWISCGGMFLIHSVISSGDVLMWCFLIWSLMTVVSTKLSQTSLRIWSVSSSDSVPPLGLLPLGHGVLDGGLVGSDVDRLAVDRTDRRPGEEPALAGDPAQVEDHPREEGDRDEVDDRFGCVAEGLHHSHAKLSAVPGGIATGCWPMAAGGQRLSSPWCPTAPELDRLAAAGRSNRTSTCFAPLAEGLRKRGALGEAAAIAVRGVTARPGVPARPAGARAHLPRPATTGTPRQCANCGLPWRSTPGIRSCWTRSISCGRQRRCGMPEADSASASDRSAIVGDQADDESAEAGMTVTTCRR